MTSSSWHRSHVLQTRLVFGRSRGWTAASRRSSTSRGKPVQLTGAAEVSSAAADSLRDVIAAMPALWLPEAVRCPGSCLSICPYTRCVYGSRIVFATRFQTCPGIVWTGLRRGFGTAASQSHAMSSTQAPNHRQQAAQHPTFDTAAAHNNWRLSSCSLNCEHHGLHHLGSFAPDSADSWRAVTNQEASAGYALYPARSIDLNIDGQLRSKLGGVFTVPVKRIGAASSLITSLGRSRRATVGSRSDASS